MNQESVAFKIKAKLETYMTNIWTLELKYVSKFEHFSIVKKWKQSPWWHLKIQFLSFILMETMQCFSFMLWNEWQKESVVQQ